MGRLENYRTSQHQLGMCDVPLAGCFSCRSSLSWPPSPSSLRVVACPPIAFGRFPCVGVCPGGVTCGGWFSASGNGGVWSGLIWLMTLPRPPFSLPFSLSPFLPLSLSPLPWLPADFQDCLPFAAFLVRRLCAACVYFVHPRIPPSVFFCRRCVGCLEKKDPTVAPSHTQVNGRNPTVFNENRQQGHPRNSCPGSLLLAGH